MNNKTMTTTLPQPLGNYSRIRRLGDTLYISGVSARLPGGAIDGVIGEGAHARRDVSQQTRRVLQNIAAILETEGASLQSCIDLTVYLTDANDFDEYNRAYSEFFEQAGPTRTTVVVQALPHPDMVVEIKAIAWAGPAG